MKALWHSDTFVVVDGFSNQIFPKCWDDSRNEGYIIVKGEKYYISYPLRLYKLEEVDKGQNSS